MLPLGGVLERSGEGVLGSSCYVGTSIFQEASIVAGSPMPVVTLTNPHPKLLGP